MDEKRKNARFRIPAPAIVTVGNREILAFTRDISTCAAYFRTAGDDHKPLVGERMEFLIKIPPSITDSSVWCIKGSGHIHRVDDLAGNETGVVVAFFDYRIEPDSAYE